MQDNEILIPDTTILRDGPMLRDSAIKFGGNTFKLWVLLTAGIPYNDIVSEGLMNTTTARKCLADLVLLGYKFDFLSKF